MADMLLKSPSPQQSRLYPEEVASEGAQLSGNLLMQSKWLKRWNPRYLEMHANCVKIFKKQGSSQSPIEIPLSCDMKVEFTEPNEEKLPHGALTLSHPSLGSSLIFTVRDSTIRPSLQRWMSVLNKGITKSPLLSTKNFLIAGKLGKGGYGNVLLAKVAHNIDAKGTPPPIAIKRIAKGVEARQDDEGSYTFDRRKSKEGRKIKHLMEERKALEVLQHPYLGKFYYSFQDDNAWYICTEYFHRGDLYHLLKKQRHRRFPEAAVKYWGAQLVSVLEYMHTQGWVHRDLKPENVLMDESGGIRLIDFGLSKDLRKCENERTDTLCGTKYYISPEMLEDDGEHNYAVDWWELGILLYELMVGKPPFSHKSRKRVYEMILRDEVKFPSSFEMSIGAISIIKGLLIKNPDNRLGVKRSIRSHHFFDGVDWDRIDAGTSLPPREVLHLKRNHPPHRPKPADWEEFKQNAPTEIHPDSQLLNNFSYKVRLRRLNSDGNEGVDDRVATSTDSGDSTSASS